MLAVCFAVLGNVAPLMRPQGLTVGVACSISARLAKPNMRRDALDGLGADPFDQLQISATSERRPTGRTVILSRYRLPIRYDGPRPARSDARQRGHFRPRGRVGVNGVDDFAAYPLRPFHGNLKGSRRHDHPGQAYTREHDRAATVMKCARDRCCRLELCAPGRRFFLRGHQDTLSDLRKASRASRIFSYAALGANPELSKPPWGDGSDLWSVSPSQETDSMKGLLS